MRPAQHQRHHTHSSLLQRCAQAILVPHNPAAQDTLNALENFASQNQLEIWGFDTSLFNDRHTVNLNANGISLSAHTYNTQEIHFKAPNYPTLTPKDDDLYRDANVTFQAKTHMVVKIGVFDQLISTPMNSDLLGHVTRTDQPGLIYRDAGLEIEMLANNLRLQQQIRRHQAYEVNGMLVSFCLFGLLSLVLAPASGLSAMIALTVALLGATAWFVAFKQFHKRIATLLKPERTHILHSPKPQPISAFWQEHLRNVRSTIPVKLHVFYPTEWTEQPNPPGTGQHLILAQNLNQPATWYIVHSPHRQAQTPDFGWMDFPMTSDPFEI